MMLWNIFLAGAFFQADPVITRIDRGRKTVFPIFG